MDFLYFSGEGLWVRYYNGVIKKVLCVKSPRQCECCKNLLIKLKVITVELEVEKDDSCLDDVFTVPEYEISSEPFLPACIITPTVEL